MGAAATASHLVAMLHGVSLEAIWEAPADPECGAREPEIEEALTKALAAATSPEERGRVHDDLARHYARRTMYRKMNRHETASMQAYAEGPDGGPLVEALALHTQARKAFEARDEARGHELLRASRNLALAHLPLRHSWVQRITHTLAGRLGVPGAPSTIDEIVYLRELLEREAIANCGANHRFTMGATSSLAYAYKARGRYEEALARFARCFHVYVVAPKLVHEAGVLLVPIASVFQSIGDPEGVAPFEDMLVAHDPTAGWIVQRTRFARDLPLRAEFNRRVVEHAAPLFVGRAAEAIFAQAIAKLDEPEPSYDTTANDVARATLALERELGIVPGEDDEDDAVTYEHPLCDAEWSFQKKLYEELWSRREATRSSRL